MKNNEAVASDKDAAQNPYNQKLAKPSQWTPLPQNKFYHDGSREQKRGATAPVGEKRIVKQAGQPSSGQTNTAGGKQKGGVVTLTASNFYPTTEGAPQEFSAQKGQPKFYPGSSNTRFIAATGTGTNTGTGNQATNRINYYPKGRGNNEPVKATSLYGQGTSLAANPNGSNDHEDLRKNKKNGIAEQKQLQTIKNEKQPQNQTVDSWAVELPRDMGVKAKSRVMSHKQKPNNRFTQSAQAARKNNGQQRQGGTCTEIEFLQAAYGQPVPDFKPRAVSNHVNTKAAYKKPTSVIAKKTGQVAPVFTSKYLEQQQPKIKNRLQNMTSDFHANGGKPVAFMPVQDAEGLVFQQFEQWQRPPSRQKEPNQAQNLDDTDPSLQDKSGWRTQAAIRAENIGGGGVRPRIDFFHQRNQNSNDFTAGYAQAAINCNAVRPPSRAKDPPMSQGLDLPDEDDLPSLDEDSDSSEEFEIGIAKAGQNARPKLHHNAQIPIQQRAPPQGFIVASGYGPNDEDVFFQPPVEEEIHLTDDPVLKDFVNLSQQQPEGQQRLVQTAENKQRRSKPGYNGTTSKNGNAGGQQFIQGFPASGSWMDSAQQQQTLGMARFSGTASGITPTNAQQQQMKQGSDQLAHVAMMQALNKPKSASGNRITTNKNRFKANGPAIVPGSSNANGQNTQYNNASSPNNGNGNNNNTTTGLVAPSQRLFNQIRGAWGAEGGNSHTQSTGQSSLVPQSQAQAITGVQDPTAVQNQAQSSARFVFRKGLAETLRNLSGPQSQAPASAQQYGQRPPESRGKRSRVQTGKAQNATSAVIETTAGQMTSHNLLNTGGFDDFNASQRHQLTAENINISQPPQIEPEERNNFHQIFNQTNQIKINEPIDSDSDDGFGQITPGLVGIGERINSYQHGNNRVLLTDGGNDKEGENGGHEMRKQLRKAGVAERDDSTDFGDAFEGINDGSGFKSQTLQFQSQLGNDFLNLFAPHATTAQQAMIGQMGAPVSTGAAAKQQS